MYNPIYICGSDERCGTLNVFTLTMYADEKIGV